MITCFKLRTKKEKKNPNTIFQSLFFTRDFVDLEDGLEFEVSLKAAGHNSLIQHSPQRGLRGVQIVCPNPTCSYSSHKRGYVTM